MFLGAFLSTYSSMHVLKSLTIQSLIHSISLNHSFTLGKAEKRKWKEAKLLNQMEKQKKKEQTVEETKKKKEEEELHDRLGKSAI